MRLPRVVLLFLTALVTTLAAPAAAQAVNCSDFSSQLAAQNYYWAVGGWPVAVVVALGYALLGCILHIDRRTRASIEANVADAVSRRDRLLGRR